MDCISVLFRNKDNKKGWEFRTSSSIKPFVQFLGTYIKIPPTDFTHLPNAVFAWCSPKSVYNSVLRQKQSDVWSHLTKKKTLIYDRSFTHCIAYANDWLAGARKTTFIYSNKQGDVKFIHVLSSVIASFHYSVYLTQVPLTHLYYFCRVFFIHSSSFHFS